MARTHGKNANFSFNAVAIEGELSEVRMDVDVGEAEITSFADVWQNYLAGKKNVVTEISGSLDLADGAGERTILAALGGGPVTTLFDLTGSGPGANDPIYTCTASGLAGVLVAAYNVSLGVAETARYRATLQHSGATTRAVA